MKKGQENLNPELPTQKSAENFPTEDHATPFEQNIPESKHEKESENDHSINDSLEGKGESTSGKGWLFILILLPILSVGTYFYFHKNKLDIFENLPWDVKKIFPEFANTTSSLDIKSKKLLIEPIESTISQTELIGSPENLTANKDKKVGFLQEEIQPLKSKFKQNNIPLLPGKIINQNQQPTDSSFDKKPDAINQTNKKINFPKSENFLTPLLPIKINPTDKTAPEKKQTKETNQTIENKSLPEIENLLAPSLPIKTVPSIQKKQTHKISSIRSKEVQAYLDFVENTGSKLVELFKKGWAELNQLILSNNKNA